MAVHEGMQGSMQTVWVGTAEQEAPSGQAGEGKEVGEEGGVGGR